MASPSPSHSSPSSPSPSAVSPSSPAPPPLSPPREIEMVEVVTETTPLTAAPELSSNTAPGAGAGAGAWAAAQLDAEANWLAERRGALMVGAMIALVFSAYQFNHPKGGEWDTTDSSHTAGQPILATTFPDQFGFFMFMHAVVVVCSSMILASQYGGFPCLRGRAILWLLTLLVWLDLLALLLAIYIAAAVLTEVGFWPIGPIFIGTGVLFVGAMIVVHVLGLCFAIGNMYFRRAT